jgi:hypothetical protein
MSIRVENMRDPHVMSLRYLIEHSETLTFEKNPPPLSRETDAFSLRLADGVATFAMKEHHASEESARRVVEGYIRPWEIAETVGPRGTGIRFVFDGSEVVDRDTSPRGPTATLSLVPTPTATLAVVMEQYPDPPEDFAVSEDVEVMWRLYEGYLQGRDRLTPMAYSCLTRFKYPTGRSPKKAAERHGLSVNILKKLSALASSGDGTTARKWDPSNEPRELTKEEERWIERTIEWLIYRAGQYAANPERDWKKLTMEHLPDLHE